MLQGLIHHSSLLPILAAFAIFNVLFRFFLRSKSKTVKVYSDGITPPKFIGRNGMTNSPMDDWDTAGDVIANNINIRAILHYVKPSGAMEFHDIEIIRLHGIKSKQGIQVGSLVARGKSPKSNLIYQFYRLRAIEDPATGEIISSDHSKALWLIKKSGAIFL